MITQIAPTHLYGIMMGTWWFLGASLGATLAGNLAKMANISEHIQDKQVILAIYNKAFLIIGIIGVIIASIAIILEPYVRDLAQINNQQIDA